MSRKLGSVTVLVGELSPAIRESVRSVIVQKKLIVCDINMVPLDAEALALVYREIGNNAAGTVALLGITEELP